MDDPTTPPLGSDPLVSVIIPAMDSARTLGAAISGVLTQTYPHVELVVVDDGSTDATGAICASYGPALVHLSTPSLGAQGARNTAVQASRGDLLVLCDARDVLLPPFIQAALDTWREAGAGRRVVTCDATLLTDSGLVGRRTLMRLPVPPATRQRLAVLQGNYVTPFTMAPRALVQEVGGFDPSVQLSEWDLWIRAVFAGWQFVAQPEPLALCRRDDPGAPGDPGESGDQGDPGEPGEPGGPNAGDRYAAEHELMRKVMRTLTDQLSADEREYLELRLAAGSPRELFGRGKSALRADDLVGARELFSQAARLAGSDRRLRLKATSVALLPPVAKLWQLGLARRDRSARRRSARAAVGRQHEAAQHDGDADRERRSGAG